jgi:hypothetical protein
MKYLMSGPDNDEQEVDDQDLAEANADLTDEDDDVEEGSSESTEEDSLDNLDDLETEKSPAQQ